MLASGNSLTLSFAIILTLGVGCQMACEPIANSGCPPAAHCGDPGRPGVRLISPQEDFGDVLFPVVSLAVGSSSMKVASGSRSID